MKKAPSRAMLFIKEKEKVMGEKKKISVLGDSISTFEGYSEPKDAVFYDMAKKLSSGVLRYADTWWGQVIEGLGGELLTLNAISGGITTHFGSGTCSRARSTVSVWSPLVTTV